MSRGGSVLIGALVIDSIGNGLFMPLSLVYFLKLTDVPLVTLGVLFSVANVVTLPIPIWAGTLVDRIGGLPVVVGAQALQAAGFLAYHEVREPVGIAAAAIMVAVGVRFFWSAIFTALSDYVDGGTSRLTKDSWFAWANMARTAGLGVGGLVTGVAVADGRPATYRAISLAVAACFVLAAVTIAVFVRAPRVRHQASVAGYRELLADRPFLGLIGINTIYAMTSMMLGLAIPTVVLTALHGPAWLVSAVLVGNTVLITLLTAPVVKRLAAYRRTRVLVVAAVIWTGWCLGLAALGPGSLWLVAPVLLGTTLLFTAAETMHGPVSQALAAATAPAAIRGRYLAVFQYSFAIASIIAPTFFTSLFEVGRALPWLALAAIDAASVAVLLLLERRLPVEALRAPERGRVAA